MTVHLPILQLLCRLLWQIITSPNSVSPIQHRFGSLRFLALSTAKIAVEKEEICECDAHTVHKLSLQHLTADLPAARESDCSWTHSKVSSDWLPCYIKFTYLVLEVFKMDRYSPNSPHT